jgi:hypothetical protein
VKKVAEDPPVFVVAAVPIPSHAKIGKKDEAGAIRAEVYRSFRLTQLSKDVTKVEYVCSMNLRGIFPQSLVNSFMIPKNLAIVITHQRYFQQVRPLSKCGAEDGRVVGRLLVDAAAAVGNATELGHTVRVFAHRTAMLRECGFRDIGTMLGRLLLTTADDEGSAADVETDVAVVNPSLVADQQDTTPAAAFDFTKTTSMTMVTEKKAIAIGSAIVSSVRHAQTLAAGLKRVTKAHAALQAMKSQYAWFLPMLEVIMAPKAAEKRGSLFLRRLKSSIIPAAPSDVVADEESGFSSVVRLGAHGPLLLCAHGLLALVPKGSTFVRFALQTYGGGTPPQVPADAHVAVDSTPVEPVAALGSAAHDARRVLSDSEVPPPCRSVQQRLPAIAPCGRSRIVLGRLVQVHAAASSSAGSRSPRSDCQL